MKNPTFRYYIMAGLSEKREKTRQSRENPKFQALNPKHTQDANCRMVKSK